jgi:hypothetical protein
MLLASEELLFVMLVCNPSIRVAAELLLVVTVLVNDDTLALKDWDVLVKDELRVVTRLANEELVFVDATSSVVRRLANEELLLVTDVVRVSTRPAREDDSVVWAEPTVVMEAASDALLLVTDVTTPSTRVAIELLFEVTVFDKLLRDALNEDDVEVNEEFNVVNDVANEELTVVRLP